MKKVRNIFSILMVAIFLVPAAGFYYNKHSCLKSGNVQIVLVDDYSCCSDKTEKALLIEEAEEQCCTNEGRYLKTDEDYTSPAKTELSHIRIEYTIALHSLNLLQGLEITIEEKAHSPPLVLQSKDILLRNSILLI